MLRYSLLASLVLFLAVGPRYVGSKHSDVYHRTTCASAAQINEDNLRSFSSPEAALEAEYRPCLRCKPPRASGESAVAARGATFVDRPARRRDETRQTERPSARSSHG